MVWFSVAIVLATAGCSRNIPPDWSMTMEGCSEGENASFKVSVLSLAIDAGLSPGEEQGSYLANGIPEYIFQPIYLKKQQNEPLRPSSPVLVVIRSPGRVRLDTLVVEGTTPEQISELSNRLTELAEDFYPHCKSGSGRAY